MAASDRPNSNVCRAPSPFDGSKPADIIFATSDNVDFYLLKGILIIASPFFADMFSLAQPAKPLMGELDRITVAEDSATIENLMRLCYPVAHPHIASFSLLGKVLEAAMKYQIDAATDTLKATFRNFIVETPLECFAEASRLRLMDEAAQAAKAWKARMGPLTDAALEFTSTIAGGSYIPEMDVISAADYFHFLQFLRSSGDEVYATRATKSAFPPGTLKTPWSIPSGVNADYILHSSDNVAYPVHSVVLRLARADKLLCSAPVQHNDSGKIEIALDLDSSAIHALLNFCYPRTSESRPNNLRDLVQILAAARKYGMQEVANLAQVDMMKHAHTEPLSTYFLARLNGWADEAEDAARHAILGGIRDVYVYEMEEAPASIYHTLLHFQHLSQAAVRRIIASHAPSSDASLWRVGLTVHRGILPASLSLPLIDQMVRESGTWAGQQRQCHICHIYCPYLFGDTCPNCQATGTRLAKMLTTQSVMESNIKDALKQISLPIPVYTHGTSQGPPGP